MLERRVRSSGRPAYGRAMPLGTPRRRRRWTGLSLLQRRLLLIAVGLIVMALVVFSLFKITTIEVEAPARVGEIKTAAQKHIAGSWQQRNLLTFDNGEMEVALSEADPSLKGVTVRRKWFHTVTVTAAMKQPSIGWSTGNQRFLLDNDGTVIGEYPAGAKFPVVVDGSNLPAKSGQRVASARFVAFTVQLVPALAAKGITVTGLSIKDTTLDLTATTNKNYRLIFDTGRGVNEEVADLSAVLTSLAAQKKTPAEYIDLRIAGKAYYK